MGPLEPEWAREESRAKRRKKRERAPASARERERERENIHLLLFGAAHQTGDGVSRWAREHGYSWLLFGLPCNGENFPKWKNRLSRLASRPFIF